MFSFRSDTVMPFEVAIVSGRYAVARASVGGVEVEVLHDPSHAHAVQRMLRGTETGLAYSMDAFGPYPWGVLRIVEVPDYGTVPGTAVSKPGLFVWNERAGFIAGPVPPGRIDPVFSTAVHEAAHQWWGHQIRPAFRGEGALALNETVAQHVRLVGLRRTFDRAAVLRYLADERDAYLFLRNRSVRDELPIARTADAYSAYEKGSLAMHSLARQLGESALTEGLRDLARRYPLTESSGPSGTDLVEAIRDAAPVSLAWLVEDWLDALTFHEASVEHVEVRRRGTSGWSVDVTVTYRRLRSDGSGNETEVEPRGRLEVEVRDAEGELLGVGRSEDPGTSRRFHLELADAPALLELDPRLLLLERDRSDNVIRIEPLVPPRPE